MIRTRIYPVTGFHIDVQESVEELENGEPTYIARDHVISFTKY